MLKFINKKLEGKTFVEINCGIGGFRVALESFGAKCMFAAERDKHAAVVYAKNFNETPDTELKNIPEHEILVAKLPYSSSKSTKSNYFGVNDIKCVIVSYKPRIVVFESATNSYDDIIEILKDFNYEVNCSTLNALNYGVPQNRKSVYIVAFRKDLNLKGFKFPEPFELTKHVEDILEPECMIPQKMYVNRPDVVMNSKDVNSYCDRPVQIGHIASNRQGERIYSVKGTAITLTANGGGQFSKTGGYLIDNKLRKLTPRECARLMGFPDDFIIAESSNQAYTQFGNSVVVDVIQLIMESIAEALCDGEIDTKKEINADSTLKTEYTNPVVKIFKFLSSIKVKSIKFLVTEFINAIFDIILIFKMYKDSVEHAKTNFNLI